MKYNSVIDAIGGTPSVRLNKVANETGASVWVKLEKMNPAGSIKDRAALYMIADAEECGLIHLGDTIVEPTSGNTGIGLAMIAATRGYKLILTMPASMSPERISILKAYGAEIILTDAAQGMNGAIEEAERLQSEYAYFMPSQFDNSANALSHYETTGKEILTDFPNLSMFIAGVGTGGTISGVGKYLKEYTQAKIVGVEPEQSKILRGGEHKPHKIQGIGAGFIPANYQTEYVDKLVGVDEDTAIQMMKRLAQEEGVFVGISSAAAIIVAIEEAAQMANDKDVLVIAPDGGERYLSLNLF